MRFNNVCIESFAYELPSEIISSEEIEKRLSPVYERLRLPYGRLEMMSGIRERRIWEKGAKPSEGALLAAEKVLKDSGVSKKDIGCLIYGAVCRDFLEPATASVLHRKMGLPKDSFIFDLSNACLGFINGMALLANMIELGQVKAGIVVSGESSRQLMETTLNTILEEKNLNRQDFKFYFASLTIGSGAAAVVMTHSSLSGENHKFLGGAVLADTAQSNLCVGGAETEVAHAGLVLMRTDSELLLGKGIELGKETWKETKKELGWSNETVSRVFCHQVGSAHRKLLYESLELDIEKDFSTFEYLGNAGSVSLPLTLAVGIEHGIVRKGDRIAMMGIGSGLNCMMMGIEW